MDLFDICEQGRVDQLVTYPDLFHPDVLFQVNRFGRTPFFHACAARNDRGLECVRYFLDHTPNHLLEPLLFRTNSNHSTPFNHSCFRDNIGCMKLLCNHPRSLLHIPRLLIHQDYAGSTPLHTALFSFSYKCMLYLLRLDDIRVSIQNDDGDTVHDLIRTIYSPQEIKNLVKARFEQEQTDISTKRTLA